MKRRKATATKRTCGTVKVHLSVRGVRPTKKFKAALALRARRMLRALSIEAPELSILLCDDGSMRTLNRDYRKQDKPTDVLAFPMGARPRSNASVLLGDVVISLPTARRQAAGRGHDAMEEVTFLLAHGLLHLLGMDHRDPEEEESMMRYACALWATSRRTLGHVDKSKAGY